MTQGTIGTNNEGIQLVARNDTTSSTFQVGTDTLKFKNENIVRSVNGVMADDNGVVDLSSSNLPDYVIETYFNKDPTTHYTQWYRKYHSGWIEQGGIASTRNTSSGQATVSLVVPMASTDYHAMISEISIKSTDVSGWSSAIGINGETFTETSFNISTVYNSANSCVSWMVVGFYRK